jgi:poly(A) polymerase
MTITYGRRLRCTNHEIDRMNWMQNNFMVIANAPKTPWPLLQRVLTKDGINELLALYEAIAGAHDPALRFCRQRLEWPPERLNPEPLIKGGDLLNHGVKPGRQLGILLEKIRDAQLNGQVSTREEALALADRLRQGRDSLP